MYIASNRRVQITCNALSFPKFTTDMAVQPCLGTADSKFIQVSGKTTVIAYFHSNITAQFATPKHQQIWPPF